MARCPRCSKRKGDSHMSSARLLAALIAFAAAPLAIRAPSDKPTSASGDELVGLWKAKRWFGPDARGPLIIQRSGSTFTADMIGQTVPVRVDRTQLSFELSNGLGKFHGTLQIGRASRRERGE